MATEERTSVSRRGFVAGTAAVSSAFVLGAGAHHRSAVFAQQEEATPVPFPEGPPADATQENGDWPHIYGSYNGWRNAPTSTIDASNAGTLGPAWRINPVNDAGPAAISGTPVVVGDTIYIGDMLCNVIAYNRADGSVKWQTNYNIPTNGPCGVAFGYGLIFTGLGESGNVAALDAATGAEVWRVSLTNMPEEGIRMAPIVYGGVVYISIVPLSTNNNPGSRGILHALDVHDGHTIWYFDLSAENLWNNARLNMGAGLWYPPTFDGDDNIYFGNGNAAPWPGTEEYPSASSRPGTNLYASTAMSLNLTTASVRWSFTPKPFDLFDLDYQIAPIVDTIPINGVDTKIAITAGKTGDIVTVNADNGLILWWAKVGKHLNDQLQQLPFDHAIEVHPGSNGGVLVPPAYKDGIVYAAVMNRPTWHMATGFERGHSDPFEGELWAIDASNGQTIWMVNLPTFLTGSLVIANDVLLTAGLDGLARAFRMSDGTQIWSFQMTAGCYAPVSVAGDELIVAAATRLVASEDQFGGSEVPEAVYELISFQLGIGGGNTTEGGETVAPATPMAAGSTPAVVQTEEATTPVAGADGVLALTIDAVDIAFSITQIEVPADTGVAITVDNLGSIQHDFKIDDPEFWTGMIPPAQSATVVVNLPAGSYEYYCTVEGHAEGGMFGTITAV